MNFDIEEAIIYETLYGSKSHGTSTPKSDTDWRGVCIPPIQYTIGFVHNFDQKNSWGDEYEDREIFGLKKFIK